MTALVALAMVLLASVAASAPTAGHSPPPSDPCADIRPCSEFGSGDVTGDGAVDRIGYHLITKPGDRFGRAVAVVIVESADGRRYVQRSTYPGFFDGPYGAAPIDGVPGAEIAMSWTVGIHTGRVEIITFRDGRLIREKSWLQDTGAAGGYGVEWIPGATPQSPIMRQCRYENVPAGKRTVTRAYRRDFTWQVDTWLKGPTMTQDYPNPEAVPWQCSRFAVPGLARSPMYVHRSAPG